MNSVQKRILTGGCIGLLGVTFFLLPIWYFSCFLITTCLYILMFEWPRFCKGWTQWLWLFAPFYIVLPFCLLIILNHVARYSLGFIFVVAFCFDTGAYIAGTLWGKHRIAPSVSPHKSWEGIFGGFIATALGISIYGAPCKIPLVLALFGISMVTLIFGTLAFAGDLFESWLKRKAGLKDSGTLLPGHGGVLDRVDSIIPIIYGVYIIMFFR